MKFFFAIRENVSPVEVVDRYERVVRMQKAKIVPPITGPQLIMSLSDKRTLKLSIISTHNATKRKEKGMVIIRINELMESGSTIESPSP